MKKFPFFSIVFFWFFLASALGLFFWWKVQLQPIDSLNKTTSSFIVDKGEGISEIALRLEQQKFIKNKLSFKIWVVFAGIAKKIKAGNYYISPSMATNEIASLLTKGANDRWFTIVEGLRSEEIAQQLIKKGFAINPENWEKEIKTKKLEGQLFPDSYLFPFGATQEEILKIVQKNFQKKVVDGLKEEWSASGKKLDFVLKMASIVEREAKNDEDRAIVAGILIKRLEEDWPLQVDATIQYAVASKKCSILTYPCDWWPDSLSKQDLQIKSSLNSYLNKGLPPIPICNPGLSSIKAVINPSASPYWYYISDLEGKMHYTKTSEEHQANISKYLLH